MDEYDRIDAAIYDCYATGVSGDVAFYVDEAKRSRPPVLELGCGTGRILIPVAEAGVELVGVDRSPSMLAVAKERVAKLSSEVQGRIELLQGDMRDFSLGRRFGLIMIPYRAFLHLLTTDDQRAALGCVREHLSDGGRLIFNVFDPRLDLLQQGIGGGSELRKFTEFTHPQTHRRVVGWYANSCDPLRQVIEQYNVFDQLDEQGTVVARQYVPLTLRYVFRYEMQHLLELCAFSVDALYSDFERGAFCYGGEQVWVAVKR
ncbi:MAG TPA: class I SAM-dependent methyltransferase [Phycisphaerae bacterium]|nr:class I SAM-dependent methyltransferase [Phycisphaerae bacterium]